MNVHPAVDYLKRLFGPSTQEPVFLCSLPNDKSSDDAGVRTRHTRDPGEVSAFATRWDRPGRGVFYGGATIPVGMQRTKDNCRETPALIIDTDFKSIDCPSAQAENVIPALRLPPTGIIRTGGGLHSV